MDYSLARQRHVDSHGTRSRVLCHAQIRKCGRRCTWSMPSDFVGNADQHPKASSDILSEVVIPSFRGLVAARHQFVENTLFDIIRV